MLLYYSFKIFICCIVIYPLLFPTSLHNKIVLTNFGHDNISRQHSTVNNHCKVGALQLAVDAANTHKDVSVLEVLMRMRRQKNFWIVKSFWECITYSYWVHVIIYLQRVGSRSRIERFWHLAFSFWQEITTHIAIASYYYTQCLGSLEVTWLN